MTILALNGSPRENGNTNFLLDRLLEHFSHDTKRWDIDRMSYDGLDRIEPCKNCGHCAKQEFCRDSCLAKAGNMSKIYNGDYDILVVSSPLYFCDLTPPLINALSRLQPFYMGKMELPPRKRLGALLLTGGGAFGQNYKTALQKTKFLFRPLGIEFDNTNGVVVSLDTDRVIAQHDEVAIASVYNLYMFLNSQF